MSPEAPALRVLGVDLSLRATGWALVALPAEGGAEEAALRARLLDAGVIETKKGPKKVAASVDLPRRATELHHGLRTVRARCEPDLVVVEGMSWPKSQQAVVAMALAWGAAAPVIDGALPVWKLAVKEALTGNRKAPKEAIVAAAVALWPEALPRALRGVARGKWEHPCDAASAVLAALARDPRVDAARRAQLLQPTLRAMAEKAGV